MKTTIKINLSGQIFTLDDDAYQALKDYLDQISKRFRDSEGGNEIIEDIEARIAELFHSRVNEKKQVITLADVENVIEIMGQPEDYLEGEEEEETKYQYTNGRKTRRLYRDPDHQALGGVAAGLAAYFGIEIWLMRLLFVILLFATGVMLIVYIVLWIAVPIAKSPAERLEMKGKRVNVQNIEKTVKEEYESVKDNVKQGYEKVKTSDGLKKTRNVLDEFFYVIGQFLLILLKVVLAIVGFAFIIGGLAVLMVIIIGFFFRHGTFGNQFTWGPLHVFPDMVDVIVDPANFTLISIALFFALIIPIVALIYGGIKMMFRFKANDKMIGLSAFILWILSVIFLVSMAVSEGANFSSSGRSDNTSDLDEFASDTLIVSMQNDPGIEGFNDDWFYSYNDDWDIISTADRVYDKISLDIERSAGDIFEMSVEKASQGRTPLDAGRNAALLEYQWDQEDSMLTLDPYFSLEKPNRWRAPETEINLLIPVEKYIRLDRSVRYFLDDVETVEDMRKKDLVGKTWQMTADGLVALPE